MQPSDLIYLTYDVTVMSKKVTAYRIMMTNQLSWKRYLGPILPNGVLPDGVHPIYGALFTHFIYSVLPTFLYALFIYGISLRRASMTGKNINICELWLVNYYEYSACDAMRTRVTHFDSFQASELPTWCLIIWLNESKTVLFTPLFHWSNFIYAFVSLVMTSLGFVSRD